MIKELRMNMNTVPEGDHIYDLYTGAYKPHIIRVALELDVFSKLEPMSSDAEEIARACACNITGISCLLDYLTSLNLLIKKDDQYSLSCDASTFLVRGKKSYAGDLITNFSGDTPWDSLRDSIRSGTAHKIDLEIHFAQDAWIESYRSARIPGSLEMWATVGISPSKRLKLKILDIACGCGIKSMVLVRESEKVELTCLDSPLVLEVGRDLAGRWGISSKVKFITADLLTAELGEQEYDCCLLGQITHYLTKQQDIDLFKRIYTVLVPGGMLILDVPMTSQRIDESSSFLSLILWANSGGRAYSFEEYQSFLKAAGFAVVDQLSERLLSAKKRSSGQITRPDEETK
jgi:ubiquinone/menaquinone biosynthesis C-methylase UbiE